MRSAARIGSKRAKRRAIGSARRAKRFIGPCREAEPIERSYFFDAALKKFEEQCLPSLFNDVKRRQRERDIEKPMLLSEESVQNLPSSVGVECGSEA